jgi:hypothetical protein
MYGGNWPHDDAEWDRCARDLTNTLPYDAAAMLDPISVDDVVSYIREVCVHASCVDINENILRDHISPLCMHIQPSVFLAKTLLRCIVLDEVVGTTVANAVRRYAYENDWKVPLEVSNDASSSIAMLNATVQELVDTRRLLVEARTLSAAGRHDLVRESLGDSLVLAKAPPQRCTRLLDYQRESERVLHYVSLQNLIENHMAISHIPKTMARSHNFTMKSAFTNECYEHDTGGGRSKFSLFKFALDVDVAIDRHTAEVIAARRRDGSYNWFSFASDESPPSLNRHAGLRFQITYVFTLFLRRLKRGTIPSIRLRCRSRAIGFFAT